MATVSKSRVRQSRKSRPKVRTPRPKELTTFLVNRDDAIIADPSDRHEAKEGRTRRKFVPLQTDNRFLVLWIDWESKRKDRQKIPEGATDEQKRAILDQNYREWLAAYEAFPTPQHAFDLPPTFDLFGEFVDLDGDCDLRTREQALRMAYEQNAERLAKIPDWKNQRNQQSSPYWSIVVELGVSKDEAFFAQMIPGHIGCLRTSREHPIRLVTPTAAEIASMAKGGAE